MRVVNKGMPQVHRTSSGLQVYLNPHPNTQLGRLATRHTDKLIYQALLPKSQRNKAPLCSLSGTVQDVCLTIQTLKYNENNEIHCIRISHCLTRCRAHQKKSGSGGMSMPRLQHWMTVLRNHQRRDAHASVSAKGLCVLSSLV